MSKATALRPLPLPDEDSRPFWEACHRGELRAQRCSDCETFRFPPRLMCPRCRSTASEWPQLSGRGTIASRVVVHPPVLPAFADRVPFAVVLVELAEDPALRMLGNVLDAAPGAVQIGLSVTVAFEPLTESITLPQWRLT